MKWLGKLLKQDGDTLLLPPEAKGLTRRQVLLGLAVTPAVAVALPKLWIPGERHITLGQRPEPVGPVFRLDDMQDEVTLDTQYDVKQLYGQNGMAVAVSRGPARIRLRARVLGPMAHALQPGDLVTFDMRFTNLHCNANGLFRIRSIDYAAWDGNRPTFRTLIEADAVMGADGSMIKWNHK